MPPTESTTAYYEDRGLIWTKRDIDRLLPAMSTQFSGSVSQNWRAERMRWRRVGFTHVQQKTTVEADSFDDLITALGGVPKLITWLEADVFVGGDAHLILRVGGDPRRRRFHRRRSSIELTKTGGPSGSVSDFVNAFLAPELRGLVRKFLMWALTVVAIIIYLGGVDPLVDALGRLVASGSIRNVFDYVLSRFGDYFLLAIRTLVLVVFLKALWRFNRFDCIVVIGGTLPTLSAVVTWIRLQWASGSVGLLSLIAGVAAAIIGIIDLVFK